MEANQETPATEEHTEKFCQVCQHFAAANLLLVCGINDTQENVARQLAFIRQTYPNNTIDPSYLDRLPLITKPLR